MKSIGFEWMLCVIALLNFLYAPLMLFLRNPPPKARKMVFIIYNNGVMSLRLLH